MSNKTTPCSVQLDSETHKFLKLIAQLEMRSMNKTVLLAIQEYIEKFRDEHKEYETVFDQIASGIDIQNEGKKI